MISSGVLSPDGHVGVGHARHRLVRVGLAAAVAGRLHAHQPRVLAVLHVADELAVLDQHVAAGRRALVVDGERAAPLGDRAVVDHGDALGGDLLAHQPGEGGGLLAVEVAFEPVADRLVQHDARPAAGQHDVEGAGGRGDGLEIDQRLAQRLVGGVLPAVLGQELAEALAAAHAVGAAFLAVAVADDDRDVDRAPAGGCRAPAGRRRAGSRHAASDEASEAVTWRTRGSLARSQASISCSSFTLASKRGRGDRVLVAVEMAVGARRGCGKVPE